VDGHPTESAPLPRAWAIAEALTAAGCSPRISHRDGSHHTLVQAEASDELQGDAKRWKAVVAALEMGDRFGLRVRSSLGPDGEPCSTKPCIIWATVAPEQSG
jgi:hypothetical protein